VVTSPTGAAIRDVLITLGRRYPLAQVVLAPTAVQGEDAPPRIVAALDMLNRSVQPDVILLVRGGGSLEDLWAFNDESVARAIAASTAPVITGVGHETDFTIADFVADLRAPTPTAAAELATPDQAELRLGLTEGIERLGRAALSAVSGQRWALSALENRLALNSPRSRLQNDRQRLDELTLRSRTAVRHALELGRLRLLGYKQRLDALDPTAVLRRGFAVASTLDGKSLTTVADVRVDDRINVRMADGAFQAQVTGLESPPGAEKVDGDQVA
jgi:exodeoxyribonuclease VII large subunit